MTVSALPDHALTSMLINSLRTSVIVSPFGYSSDMAVEFLNIMSGQWNSDGEKKTSLLQVSFVIISQTHDFYKLISAEQV